MSIEIRRLDARDRWDDLVRKSETGLGFHLAGALDVFAAASDTTLDRLVGYKGEEPCGLFPAFTTNVGPVAAMFSPPPNLKVNYLGPCLVNFEGMKQRRRQKRHGRFVDAAIDWLERERGLTYGNVRSAPGYDDVRPFVWNDFDAEPRYTYTVDLDRGEDDLLAAFSTDARRNVTDDYDVSCELSDAGPAAIDEVVDAVRSRHEEIDEPFPVDGSFVRELASVLPDGAIRTYVCRRDGQLLAGTVSVELEDYSVGWMAYADSDADFPASDVLEWRYMRDAIDRGITDYDLAGANVRRISSYKAKFGPALVPYYNAEYGSSGIKRLASLYDRL